MSWEVYRPTGRSGRYPDGWHKYPAVAISKSGFTFNLAAMRAFGIKPKQTRLVVYHESTAERRAVGFKVAEHGAIRAQENSKTTVRVACPAVARRFPDCFSHAYRAHLNPADQIIEVELSPSNMLR